MNNLIVELIFDLEKKKRLSKSYNEVQVNENSKKTKMICKFIERF